MRLRPFHLPQTRCCTFPATQTFLAEQAAKAAAAKEEGERLRVETEVRGEAFSLA